METSTSTAFPSNTSSSGHLPAPPSMNPRDLTCAVILSLGFLLGFFGNIAVIIFRPKIQRLSPVTQSLMLNMAVSDLLCVLTVPFGIYDVLFNWTIGLLACKLLTFVLFLCLYGSLMSVTLLSVQRYLVVVKQRNTLNHFGTKRLLVLLWITSFMASIPVCLAQKVIEDHQKTYCTLQFSTGSLVMVVLIEEITLGFVTFSIVAFSYICLYKKTKLAAFFNNRHTTRLVSSITVSYFVLNFPYIITDILSVVAISLHMEDLLEFCRNSRYPVGTISVLKCVLNPLLYAFTSCDFWKCTEKLNCWCLLKTK